jgi:hypothetical protein
LKLFIDPGVLGTGLAFFEDGGKLYSTYVIKPKGRSWEDRSQNLITFFGAYVRVPDLKVYCERPQFMESGKGHTSARRGDLVKLVLVAGGLMGMCLSKNYYFEWVEINHWKGQLKKEQVDQRIWKRLRKRFGDHESDAVGIGLYHFGKF